jgi:hypothetical protein
MLTYSTGGEPDHTVAVNPLHVAFIEPKGKNWTYIHLSDGSKHLVDATFNQVVDELRRWLEEH